ncbi:MAG: cobalamin-dependent protein, partial [Firmicutes bacterium]|nr:cobalamin-dependent protein [Bacillota bacterium]
SYGFYVMDLGKDVAPETIRDAALENGCKLVGLSALMTTTVPAMEETIKLIREADPAIKVMVGGAVLTQEYADRIGADAYSPDAMGAVRYAEEYYKGLEAGS